MLLGLCGAIGSGKSVIAEDLQEFYGFRRLKIAEPIKRILKLLLVEAGCPESQLNDYIEGVLKPAPCPYLKGRTSRVLQQLIGELARREMGQTFWRDIAMGRAQELTSFGFHVVIDDIRYPDEAQAIKSCGGILVRISRNGVVNSEKHRSETEAEHLVYDSIFANIEWTDTQGRASCFNNFITHISRVSGQVLKPIIPVRGPTTHLRPVHHDA